ncbi:MAG TPA: nitrilase-related carbon-nitrogen hydrolase [Thermodesulfobacteriota bacterium]|nr:nitrilase-related carbon-nitrogen hydrolase [Thermodesulfobacteriota bacterium]
MHQLRVAGIQFAAGAEPRRNLDKALKLLALAADKGARLAALPELSIYPWFPRLDSHDAFGLAEPADGPSVTAVREVARQTGMVVVFPFFEAALRDGEPAYYNAAAVIDADGRLVGVYRKNHVPQLPPLYEERRYFEPATTGFPVFRTAVGTIGVQICWDNFFPEGARILGLKGADLVVAPTAAATFAARNRWETAIAANAIANGYFVLRVNRVGEDGPMTFYGRTFCINPYGEFAAEPAGDRDGVVLVTLDLRAVAAAREQWPFLRDRREGAVYAELVR